MAKKSSLLSKTLVISIIVLFICISTFTIGGYSSSVNSGISLITIQVAGEIGWKNWYISDVGFTFTNESEDIAEIRYRIDGGSYQTYNEPFYLTKDGKDICLEWYAVDYEGNYSDVDGPFFCSIDQTPPEVEISVEVIGGNPWQGWDILFTANATDAMSGMERVEFYINDVLKETVYGPGPEYWGQFKYHGGWHMHISFKATAYDNVGNSASDEILISNIATLESPLFNTDINEESTVNVCLDDDLESGIVVRYNYRVTEKSPSDSAKGGVFDPAYVIVVLNRKMGDNGWFISNVSIPILYESDRIDEVYYQLDEEGWRLYSEPLVISDEGVHSFSWYVIDSEGYNSTPDSIGFKIDRTRPDIKLIRKRLSINQVKYIANVYDEMSGVDRVEFSRVGFHTPDFIDYDFPYEWIWSVIIPGDVKAIVFDKAGNRATDVNSVLSNQISYNHPRSSNYPLNSLYFKLLERFPLLEVFLRLINK